MAISQSEEVVLITGCSSGGIGWALAIAFADRGCQVVATSRSLTSMEDLQNKPRITTYALDVTVDETIAGAVDFVIRKYGRIDILVNNAGVPCVAPVAEVPLSLVVSAFETNVYGPIKLIQAVVPHLVAKGKGKIVNIGSVVGMISVPWDGVYCATKAALHALTDSLRIELKPFGIDVVLVAPGAIVSNFGSNAGGLFNSLPPLKLYKPFEESVFTQTTKSQDARSTPTSEFAQKTVHVIMQKKPPRFFIYGFLSGICTLFYYTPLWFRDWCFEKSSKCSSTYLKKTA